MDEEQDFKDWLTAEVIRAGYDLSSPRAGGRSALAKDAGVSLSQIVRTLDGTTVPDIKTQRGIARALGIPLQGILLKSGLLTREDLADPETRGYVSRATVNSFSPLAWDELPHGERSILEFADRWRIPREDLKPFVRAVKALVLEFAEDAEPRD